MKRKAIIVLEALYVGLPVTLKTSWGEVQVWLGEDEDGHKRLATESCLIKFGQKPLKKVPKLIALNMGLYAFLKACEQMTDEQIAELGANIALNKLKEGDRR